MTINLQTLKCDECGSGQLERIDMNQYECAHCGSISVVEDSVSERLDRVLEQVKEAAAKRLAAEQAEHRRAVARKFGWAAGLVGVLIVGVALLTVLLGDRRGPTPVAAPAARQPPPIATEGVKVDAPRQVMVGRDTRAQPQLLVTVRNETGEPLEEVTLQAQYFDGEQRIGESRAAVPVSVLLPGESVPLLLALPGGDKRVSHQQLQVLPLRRPARTERAEPLGLDRVRLLAQQDGEVRFVARVQNAFAQALAGLQVLVTLYDDAGHVVGFGRGYASGNDLPAHQRSTFDVRVPHFGRTPVAAWDWRLSYALVQPDGVRATALATTPRVHRETQAPEPLTAGFHMSTADLLADEAERFPSQQMALAPLMAGRTSSQRPLYLTELVNSSSDAIALAPGAIITPYSGAQALPPQVVHGPAWLYPGDRFPVHVETQRDARITDLRVEWKPMRRAALPGPRADLQVEVTDTRAQVGHALVNFSQRYAFKYVDIEGRVTNKGREVVRNPRLWVSLRDKQGRLSGFEALPALPPLPPGESLPFKASVNQGGRDFASVEVLHDAQ